MVQVTSSPERQAELLNLIGDPAEIADELARFAESARAFSSDMHRFIDQFPQRWVAVCGDTVLDAESLEGLLEMLDEAGLPRARTLVRFVDRNTRALVI